MTLCWHVGAVPFPNVSYGEDLSATFAGATIDERFPASNNSERKLLLIHTGRCGSTLLHHHFVGAGVCPPFEIFNPAASEKIAQSIGKPLPVSVDDYVYEYRRLMLGGYINDPSCVVSYSITPWALYWLVMNAPEIARWLFNGATVVFLTRRNIVRQAISYAIASNTGKWHSFKGASEVVELPSTGWRQTTIEHLDLILWAERSLELPQYSNLIDLSESQISITYENLIENQREILSLIFYYIGVDHNYYQKSSETKLPVKSQRSEDTYLKLVKGFPFVLPSGYIFSEEMFLMRMKDH